MSDSTGERVSATLSELTDRELIDLTRAGDTEAYGVIFGRHRLAAFAVARRFGRQPADCEDVVASAFTEVLQAIRNGAGPQEAFRPYLLTCVRRIGARQSAARSTQVESEDDYFDAIVDDSVRPEGEVLNDQLVKQAFIDLPERSRVVLWHALVEGQDLTTVGRMLGMNANACASLLHRSKEKLRLAYLAEHLAAAGSGGCGVERDQLVSLGAGRLSQRSQAALQAHVARCAACQARMDELGDVMRAMKSVVAPAIVGMPAAEYVRSLASLARRAWWQAHWGRVAAAAGGVAAVAVVALLLALRSTPPLPAAGVEELAGVESAGVEVSAASAPGPEATAGADASGAPVALPSSGPTASVASTAAGSIAPAATLQLNPGDSSSLRVQVDVPAGGGEVVITLPDGVDLDRSRLGEWCREDGAKIVCAQDEGVAVVGVPITIPTATLRGTTLAGGTAMLRLADGTEIGPIALSIVIPVEPC